MATTAQSHHQVTTDAASVMSELYLGKPALAHPSSELRPIPFISWLKFWGSLIAVTGVICICIKFGVPAHAAEGASNTTRPNSSTNSFDYSTTLPDLSANTSEYSLAHHPHVKRIGSLIPGTDNAYFGGWHILNERTLNIIVTDTPHFDSGTAFTTYKQRIVDVNGETVPAQSVPSSHKNTLQRRKSRKNHSGWDHCTVWPTTASMSGCSRDRGTGVMWIAAANEDHWRALLLYLMEAALGPAPTSDKYAGWSPNYNGACIDWHDARMCISWAVATPMPQEGWPLSQYEKRLILDYSQTCSQQDKSAQHALWQPDDTWRSICITGDLAKGDNCNHGTMGCHFDKYYKSFSAKHPVVDTLEEPFRKAHVGDYYAGW